MSVIPLAIGKRVDAREKNLNLQRRVLEPNDENRALLKHYNDLVAQINAIPARIAGLRMNFRKRDVPMAMAKLMAERSCKMAELLEIEKTLFPKT